MERKLLITLALILMMPFFTICAHAAITDCDFSDPADGYIDGLDLSQFADYFATSNSLADVDGIGGINSADVAHFAGFFGSRYTVTARRPNILLIIGDDIGFDVTTDMYPGLIDQLLALYDPSYHDDIDGTPASTPKLNTLAQQGMRFRNAWAQPVCSPTRASIITGLFAAKHHVIDFNTPLHPNYDTFVQKLKNEAGYSTAAFGKWHLGTDGTNGVLPRQAGFDLYKGILGAAPSSYWSPNNYVMQNDSTGDEGTVSVTLQPTNLDGIGPTTYLPVVKAADTIDWINARQAANPDKPWFAYVAMNLSHAVAGSPIMVVPDEDTLDAPSRAEIVSCGGSFGSASVGSCDGRQLMRAMTNSLDTVIGKLLEAVDSIPSDTYVIYVSDNGTPMYSFNSTLGSQIGNMYITRGGRGKGTVYESGARVAMAIKGPDIEPGSESSEFVHVADLFSTILELAGLTPPVDVSDGTVNGLVPLDAVSLSPILFDGASAVRNPDTGYILTENNDILGGNVLKAGARNAKYKVVCANGTGTSNCEFYDLETDPLEEDPRDEYETTSCVGWGTGDPQWHYCHLIGVINDYSILAP